MSTLANSEDQDEMPHILMLHFIRVCMLFVMSELIFMKRKKYIFIDLHEGKEKHFLFTCIFINGKKYICTFFIL